MITYSLLTPPISTRFFQIHITQKEQFNNSYEESNISAITFVIIIAMPFH